MKTFSSSPTSATPPAWFDQWKRAWPEALAVWSKFTRLSDPQLCASTVQAAREGLSGSFAMIRLLDQSVVVDLENVGKLGLEDYGVEVLAHEIGHHVLAPANVTDHYRLLARIRKALPTLEKYAALVGNLYTDLLINDRLQRHAGLRMGDIYKCLAKDNPPATKPGVWALYMRIYEYLWQLDKGTLVVAVDDDLFDTHAWLGARIVRVYAKDWLTGGGRFATLLLPYLVDDAAAQEEALSKLHDTKDAGLDCEPGGLVDIDPGEFDDAIHPSEDPLITDGALESSEEKSFKPSTEINKNSGLGQRREPFEYGEILKAAGLKLSDHELAVRYYREAALPYLIPFPSRVAPESKEPLIEGLEIWEIGDPLDEIDWLQSVSLSPTVVPGLTTVKRQYGLVEGAASATVPIDLDIYIDSSGSMPNPQQRISYMALAGAVICLSALRVGSRVQATLWSGKHQVTSTSGFVSDQDAVLRVLTGFYGGGTTFPIHVLRETFSERKATDRDCHILMISDDGITTMFEQDELGNSGWDISAKALAAGRAGGTMALNLYADWQQQTKWAWVNDLHRAQQEQGWEIYSVNELEALVEFARDFSRRHYGKSEHKNEKGRSL